MGRRGGAGVAAVGLVVAAVLFGCGDDKRVGDDRIIERLKLEELPHTEDYGIEGDPFCAVSQELLNDADEVDEALDADEGAVVASSEGNVGVAFTGPIGRDCERKARKGLNELDPAPKD